MRSLSRSSPILLTLGCIICLASPTSRVAVTVSPARAGVVISTQTQQFTASAGDAILERGQRRWWKFDRWHNYR